MILGDWLILHPIVTIHTKLVNILIKYNQMIVNKIGYIICP